MRKENDNMKIDLQKNHNYEIEQLKMKIGTLAMMEGKNQIESIKNEFNDLKKQNEQTNKDYSIKNPL